MKSKAILAFDFGTKSIGVAATQGHESQLTSELPPLKAKEGIPNWQELEQLLNEWSPEKVVVGLPIKMDGGEMEITRRARKFGNRLQGRFNMKVEFMDETLSTKAAKNEADERGHKGHYASDPVDSIAARLILESWLSEQGN